MSEEFFLDYGFSTADGADSPHLRALSHLMDGGPNPIKFDCVRSTAPYACRFSSRACESIGLSEFRVSSTGSGDNRFLSERTAANISRNQAYGFHVAIWLAGDCTMLMNKHSHAAQPGMSFLMDTETPFQNHVGRSGHAVNLALPASWDRIGDTRMEDVFGLLPAQQGRRRDDLINYVRRLLDHPGDLALPGTADELRDVLALAFNPESGSQHAAGLLALIRNYVDEHCCDPDLDPARVAASFNVSVRHLHRLFATSNTSFNEYLIEQRLTMAQRKLGDARYLDQKILTTALDCGFRNINHFGRRFRDRYGITPGEFRQESLRVGA